MEHGTYEVPRQLFLRNVLPADGARRSVNNSWVFRLYSRFQKRSPFISGQTAVCRTSLY